MKFGTSIFSAFVAYKLLKLAEKLSSDVLKLTELARLFSNTDSDDLDLVDPTGEMTAFFVSMLNNVKELHQKCVKVLEIAKRHNNERLTNVSKQLVAVCVEYHESVAALSWAILEHDASLSERTSSHVANTTEEVGLMLDRIASGQ